MIDMAVVLNAHEDSPVFRDTLESVTHHWTDDVLVVVDGRSWPQFAGAELGVPRLEGFYHGKPSSPCRNVCLGLMKSWERWGESKGWYCYMEYDCLVGSSDVARDLAGFDGAWVVGNDHRQEAGSVEFIERFQRARVAPNYLLGCCVFLSSEFMANLARDDFFERFLNYTNFHPGDATLKAPGAKEAQVYDISEYLYPTLCVHYGGRVGELACWEDPGWRGMGERYPMRFRPDLDEGLFEDACVLHPLKSVDSPARSYHRQKRTLTPPICTATIPDHAGLRGPGRG